jgi:hypothetical protein
MNILLQNSDADTMEYYASQRRGEVCYFEGISRFSRLEGGNSAAEISGILVWRSGGCPLREVLQCIQYVKNCNVILCFALTP